MQLTRRGVTRKLLAARIAVAAVTVAGLSSTALAVDAGAAGKKVTVTAFKSGKLGTILASGKTLYVLDGNKPCKGSCLTFWPALKLPKGVSRAMAGSGVNGSKLGTKPAAGGGLQVTYGGKALYWYSGDSKPGQVNGNNVTDSFGKWNVLVVKKSASTSSSGGSSSSGSSGGSTGGAGF